MSYCQDDLNTSESSPLYENSLMQSIKNIINVTEKIRAEIDSASYKENVRLRREYDYVIIGAGPSGCILANRLSEDIRNTVLLIEAGSPENPIITNIPMSAPNLQSTNYNWNYATEPQKNACLCMLLLKITNHVILFLFINILNTFSD